jgi:type VI secretion system FHA domain protein
MRLILHLESAGEQHPVTGDRCTIGRARENDWVLPDTEQHLSRQHCVIERRGDGFCVVDTSSNGVFVNDESAPLGRGHERGLGQGDRLQLGSHTIRVEVEGAAAPAGPSERGKLFDPTHVAKVPPKEDAGLVFDHTWVGRRELGPADHSAAHSARHDPRFQTPPEHRPVDLGRIAPQPAGMFDSQHPAPAPTEAPPPSDHVEADALFDCDGPGEAPVEPQKLDPLDPFATAGPAPVLAASPPPAPQPSPATVPAAPAVPAEPATGAEPPRAPEVPDARLLEAFLAGAGLDGDTVPVDDPETFMRAAGARLRELTEGLVQLLNARASVKNVVRVERTTIGRDDNNPLKYSGTLQEALLAVLKARGPGFLSPEATVRGGFRDIQEHELALLHAMQVALRALLQRFEPDGFERQLEAESLFSTLVAGGRRAKCWEAFKARYEQIASEAEREFLGDVGTDFSRSYEARTRRM